MIQHFRLRLETACEMWYHIRKPQPDKEDFNMTKVTKQARMGGGA